MVCSCRDEEAITAAHFLMKQADGVQFMIVRPEGVRADKFCQTVGLVRRRTFHAAHFVKNNGYAERCRLPGCFASGHAAADNVNGFDAHPA